MPTGNHRYLDLPSQTRISCHRQFNSSQDDPQATISEMIPKQTAHFLWIIQMAISDQRHQDGSLLQCALKLERVIYLLSEPIWLNDSTLSGWQDFLFKFGIELSTI